MTTKNSTSQRPLSICPRSVQHVQLQKGAWQKWIVMGTALLIAGRVVSQYQPGIKAIWETVASNPTEGASWWDRIKQLSQWIPSAWTDWMSRVSRSLSPQMGQMVTDLISDAQSLKTRAIKGVMSTKRDVFKGLPDTVYAQFPQSILIDSEQWNIDLQMTDEPPGQTTRVCDFEVILLGHMSRSSVNEPVKDAITRYQQIQPTIKPLTLLLLSNSADTKAEQAMVRNQVNIVVG